MISRTYIWENLRSLDARYRKARSQKESIFVSKLAVLELCGWIEEAMDDIVMRYAMRCLAEQANRNYVRDEVIKRNYSFDYNHFRSMVMRVAGLGTVESLERRLDQAKLAKLKATLNKLKLLRNSEAHTHVKGITKTIDAPSLTMQHFRDVYDALHDFQAHVRKLK